MESNSEYPEYITPDIAEKHGIFPCKVFVDGVEIPDVEIMSVEHSFVVAALHDNDGIIFVPDGKDYVARKIVQGKVTFEHSVK